MYINNINYNPFGIDTIAISISPLFVNIEKWDKGAFHKKIEHCVNGNKIISVEHIKRIGEKDYLTLVKKKNP